jgi:nitrite reductase/ring-hydroxylating ferredoxin subunit
MTEGLLRLIGTNEVPEGEGRRVQAAGGDYAVFNLGGVFHVTQNRCTHGPGDLGEGFVEGEEVECDFHQGRFHIPTGRPTAPPCTEPLRVWQAVVQEGAVWINPAAGRVCA